MLTSFEAPITGTNAWLAIFALFVAVSTIFDAHICTLANRLVILSFVSSVTAFIQNITQCRCFINIYFLTFI